MENNIIDIPHFNTTKSYAISRQNLMSTGSADINEIYNGALQNLVNAVTVVLDNDSNAKFENATDLFNPNSIQLEILNKFKSAFQEIEKCIDPEKIDFSISKAMDDEICLDKNTFDGVTKIIINEDGYVVFTFTAYVNSGKKDIFEPLGIDFDYEKYTYNFLSN